LKYPNVDEGFFRRLSLVRTGKGCDRAVDETRPTAHAPLSARTRRIDVRYFCRVPDISELPNAYKNAASVRRQIERFDLAEIVDEILPLGNIMAGDWQRDAPWRTKRQKPV
jgi:hypothetical protein